MVPFINKEIKTISKDLILTIGSIRAFYIIVTYNDFKTPQNKLDLFTNFKKCLIELITYEVSEKENLCYDILREYFEFYAEYNLLIDGLKFFEKYPDFIKISKFTSLKAFLFYFAYQSKRYTSPMVKELLSQELLNTEIKNPKEYLDFCMYCFFKGLYYIEKKNYFMATYLYCAAVHIGLRNPFENVYILNEFSIQMIRVLCFLKGLSDFDITNYLFKSHSRIAKLSDEQMKYGNIDECLSYLRKDKIDFDSFNNFIKSNKDIYNDYKLIGLKNEASEILMFLKVKDNLKLYKRIKLTKLAQITNIEFNKLIKVIKKKCMEGELNVKYDEESDVIEVFDIDPGMKENAKKTQNLYKSIIEGNKNYFISIRDKKLKELNHEGNFNENMIVNAYYDDEDDDD